jgi:hypothetical protein
VLDFRPIQMIRIIHADQFGDQKRANETIGCNFPDSTILRKIAKASTIRAIRARSAELVKSRILCPSRASARR